MIRKLLCRIGRHKYHVIYRFGCHSSKIGCDHCNRKWAMNDNVRTFLPWDQDFESLAKMLKKQEAQ